jgi:hypothetical protein
VDAFNPAIGLGLCLELGGPFLAGEPVRWTFAVTNVGDEARTLAFLSAQRGDVVLKADGVERYRWSRDKLFAAVITEKKLPAGEEWVFTLDDVLAVEPGTYSLLATVTATPAPAPVLAEISVASA